MDNYKKSEFLRKAAKRHARKIEEMLSFKRGHFISTTEWDNFIAELESEARQYSKANRLWGHLAKKEFNSQYRNKLKKWGLL